MEHIHRYDSKERQHFLYKKNYSLKLKPRLVYAGTLDKSKGWQENPHSHNFCEIIFITQGSGWITIGDVSREVKSGDVIIYNAGLDHAEESSSHEPMELYFMALDHLQITNLPKNHFLPPDYDIIYPVGKFFDIVSSIFRLIITELSGKDQFYSEIAQGLSRSLVMYLFRIVNEYEKDTTPLLQRNKNIDSALQFIHENYRQELTLEEIAANCYLNKYYFSHLFTAHMGMSVGKYILNLRLQEAQRLLRESDMPVSDIAEQIGFNDMSYFCRAFKREMAMTPLQYRRQGK